MIHRQLLFIFLSAFLTSAHAAVFATTTTPPSPALSLQHVSTTTTTPAPIPQYGGELRKRLSVNNSNSLCGTSAGRTHYCVSGTNMVCAATILPDGNAYQYCSNPKFADQDYHTTALPNWDRDKPCPALATCCADKVSSAVKENLFVASGYTVTGFGCAFQEVTYTFNPLTNLLDPAKFSASLAQIAPSTSSKSKARTSPTNDPASANNGQTSSSPQSSSSNSRGLSPGAKTGIGVGVGVGAGAVLTAGLAFLFWRRQRKGSQVNPGSEYHPGYPSSTAGYNRAKYDPQEMAAAYPAEVPYSPSSPQEIGGIAVKPNSSLVVHPHELHG